MKKSLLLLSLALTCFNAYSQIDSTSNADSVKIQPVTAQPVIGFDPPPSQQNGYTDSSLSRMTKMQLTDVYLSQVEKLAISLPYSPFTLDRADSLNNSLDIPTSNYVDRKLNAVQKMSASYGELMREKLYEIVPYSDKREIINAILFLQEINWSVKQPPTKK